MRRRRSSTGATASPTCAYGAGTTTTDVSTQWRCSVPSDRRTAMWEAKAGPGRHDELLAFVLAHAPADADVYRSADARIVVIDHTGRGLPDPPSELLARPVHVWM